MLGLPTPAAVSIVISASTAMLGIVMWLATLKGRKHAQVSASQAGPISILIPHYGPTAALLRLVESLNRCDPARVSGIVVVVQSADGGTEGTLRDRWHSTIPMIIVSKDGSADKSRAISRGLEEVASEFVMLVDSDMKLDALAITQLTQCLGATDAIYGIVRSKPQGGSRLLDATVSWDKAVSHGVWRWGRAALGLWPNIPGQCFVARASMLRRIHAAGAGFLDDLTTTLAMIERGYTVQFIPAVVGEEESRSTWSGLVLQRTRWSLGLLQSGWYVLRARRRLAPMLAGLALHAWLYHGWPVGTAVAATYFAHQLPAISIALLSIFLGSWTILAALGASRMRSISHNRGISWIGAALLPASAACVMVAQTLGALLAPIALLFGLVRRSTIKTLHRR